MNEFFREINDVDSRTRTEIPLGESGCVHDNPVLSILRNRIVRRDKRIHVLVSTRRDMGGYQRHICHHIDHRKHPQEHTQMVRKRCFRQSDYRRRRL